MKKVEQIEKEEPSIKIWNFFRSLPTKSLKALMFFLILMFLSSAGAPNAEVAYKNTTYDSVTYALSVKKRAEDNLILEVDKYIKSKAPESKLSAENLVKVCIKYDLDITFVLAQGLLESHYGTKGIAATTNSVFNVGTYDDGQILYTYDTPDQSVEPYAKLLHEKYLLLGDSIQANDKKLSHLIKDRGYKNASGHRFATAKRYEKALRDIMVEINMETSIKLYQGIVDLNDYDILAYFGPTNLQYSIN